MANMREGLSGLYRHLTGGPWPYSVAGIVLLLGWFGWWGASLAQHAPHLLLGSPIGSSDRITYIPSMPLIGLDFQHNYAGVKTWLREGNPYLHMTGDPMSPRYSYPPLTLWAFVWVGLFSPQSEITVTWQGPDGTMIFALALRAIYVWMAAIAGIVSFAAWQSWRARNLIGLSPLPLLFILGATLISYPVMFQLERGNCDVLPLLAVTILVCAFDMRNRLCGDLVVAVCVVFAAGIKAYPGILLLGLVALRHYRAAVFAAALMILKVVMMWPMLSSWLNIIRNSYKVEIGRYCDYSHSLPMHWELIWRDMGLPSVARISALPVVVGLVLVVVLYVSWKVFQAKPSSTCTWPYLLWLLAMGTLVNTISMDYNLLYIPLEVLAVFDYRDRWWRIVLIAPLLLWLQPFYIGITGLPLLLIKVISVIFTGQFILHQLGSLPAPASVPPKPATI